MKLSDRIALAKAGYKKSEIEEIIKSEQAGLEEETVDEVEEDEEVEETEDPEPDTDTGDTDTETRDPEPDYKSLYEKTLDDLKKAQEANRKQVVATDKDKTDEQTLEDIIKEFI